MRSWPPIPPAELEALLDFTPAPRRYRHNGWTPERQRAFIAALADTGCVTEEQMDSSFRWNDGKGS